MNYEPFQEWGIIQTALRRWIRARFRWIFRDPAPDMGMGIPTVLPKDGTP